MAAASPPLACGEPDFMEEQPFDGPGNDPIDDRLAEPPRIVDRIGDAETRVIRRMIQPVDVLRRFAGAPRVATDRRVEDEHADIRVQEIEPAKHPSRKMDDADAIGLADRP